MIGQQNHIAAAFPERRQINGENIKAVKKIRTETVGENVLLQITVRRGDDSYIDIHHPRRAQRLKALFLQHAQKLYLRGGGQFAHFIQKDRAAVGFFEAAAARLQRAGK